MTRTTVAAFLIAIAAVLPTAAQEPDLAGSYYHFSLAKLADLDMRYSDAIIEFEKAIALDPNSARLRVEFASTLWKARQVERAVRECEKAIQLDPRSSEAHFMLAQIYKNSLETGSVQQMDKAIEEFRKVVELDGDNYEALFYLGQLLFFRGDNEETAATFARFIQLRPFVPKAYNYRALALVKLGEIHGAIEVLEESLKIQEDNLENLDLLARLYEQSREYEKALDTHRKSLSLAPTTETKFRTGSLLARMDRFQEAAELLREVVNEAPGQLEFRVELGKALEGGGNFAEAVQQLQKALEIDPDNIEAGYYLASCLRALGKRDQAVEQVQQLFQSLDSLAKTNPEQAEDFRRRFRSFLAVLHQESRQYDKAVEIFRELTELDQDDLRAQLGLIYALKDAGRLPEALRLSQDLAVENPDDMNAVITRARVLAAAGQLDEAEELLRKQIDASSDERETEDLYLVTSQIYSENKMYARAERLIREGRQRLPKSERMEFQLGALFERQGKVTEAEAAFQSILETNPNHAAVLNYLGYMLAERGERLMEALRYVERALEIEPHNGAYLDSLGWVYFKLNKLDQAETKLVQAVQINDSDPTIYEHLGDLYYKKGDYAKARSYYERSVQFAEDDDEREKVEGKLASLNELMAPQR